MHDSSDLYDSSDIYYVCELIEALDRRLPQPHRADEPIIASQAADLRRRAVRRLAELRAQSRYGHARLVVYAAQPRG
jgi:hypothetical protein